MTKEGRYYNITPGLFLGQGGFLTDDRPTGWNDDALHRTIQKGSKYLVHFYCNITFALLKTYWNIINFVNFCEGNNYSYLIFDGINNHIPYKKDEKWYLSGSGDYEKYEIVVEETDNLKEFIKQEQSPILLYDLIEYIKDLKYYHNSPTLHSFITTDRDDGLNSDYHEGNQGHPNELGAKMWAKHLVKVLQEKFDEIK